ncbi:MAG TPA: MMPL family transporter [Gaiellaceae bacterium]|nr:MMPL family transporter [Gaiellaceae bacterium]
MSPLKPSDNLAARMGRWSAGHWKTAVFGWLAFVIAALMLGQVVGTKQIDKQDANVGQSHRADQMLRDAGFRPDPQTEIVLVQSTSHTASEPAFRAVVNDVVDAVAPSGAIANLRSPYQPGRADQISANGHAAMVQWEMKGDAKLATSRIGALTAAIAAVAKEHAGFYVGEAGSISSGKALSDTFGRQLAQAGERSIPLTLVVLLLVFGAIVAAGVPLLLALSAVAGTMGLLALPSQLVPMDQSVSAVVLLVGLAVGVDYSLFYLKREREERAAGKDARAALEAAAATSGRSVLISGVTVMIAMAGMLFTGDKIYLSLGTSTMIVVAAAMLGSLTVLPALLSRLGDRVEKGRIPVLGRLRRQGGESRFWAALLTPALRKPLLSAIAATAVLLMLAAPALNIHTSQAGFDSLPASIPTVTTIGRLQTAFPGNVTPAVVAIKANTDAPATIAAIGELRREALASGQMREPIQVDLNPSHTVARLTVPLLGKGTDAKSTAALRTLRNRLLPATIGKLPGATYAVTGGTASSVDGNDLLKRSWPLVFAFVLTFAFLLLLVSFRSIVIAVKAILLNLLSVAAAYGALVATFQYGWGESLLNFRSNGSIASWLPIFMFLILFGLSMDYHVFILSRIREAYDRGLSTEDAVAQGIKTTAGVVTSAALVMVGVFSIFATLPILEMKEAGVGLAAAVLIDATIVRAVLLPATMKLLGDWNWYLPRWLNWLPKRAAPHRAGRRRDAGPASEAVPRRPPPMAARALPRLAGGRRLRVADEHAALVDLEAAGGGERLAEPGARPVHPDLRRRQGAAEKLGDLGVAEALRVVKEDRDPIVVGQGGEVALHALGHLRALERTLEQ